MSRIATLLAIFWLGALSAIGATYTVATVPNVHSADRTRYVSNPDAILSPPTEASLNEMLAELWAETTTEVAIVVVGSIPSDMTIDDFATELFTQWGIGKADNDNGLLMVVSRDDRKMTIRTGRGMEGAVPDILAGRIIRNVMTPAFKQGDYDGGVAAGMNELSKLIRNPEVAKELLSKQPSDSRTISNDDLSQIVNLWLVWGTAIAGLMLLAVWRTLYVCRRDNLYDRYQRLSRLRMPLLCASFVGLGIPLVALLMLRLIMRRLRVHRRLCPNCQSRMRRLDEAADNAYLTAAQDVEEQIGSVDYDVWLCDNCGETDILPFVSQSAHYQNCPRCGARAVSHRGARVVVKPTYTSPGRGERIYGCRNCGNTYSTPYEIPCREHAAPIIIPGGGGFGGGGISGGSFGGGATGGGGASGSW